MNGQLFPWDLVPFGVLQMELVPTQLPTNRTQIDHNPDTFRVYMKACLGLFSESI